MKPHGTHDHGKIKKIAKEGCKRSSWHQLTFCSTVPGCRLSQDADLTWKDYIWSQKPFPCWQHSAISKPFPHVTNAYASMPTMPVQGYSDRFYGCFARQQTLSKLPRQVNEYHQSIRYCIHCNLNDAFHLPSTSALRLHGSPCYVLQCPRCGVLTSLRTVYLVCSPSCSLQSANDLPSLANLDLSSVALHLAACKGTG